MNTYDAKMVAGLLNDQACYGQKEHPVRLSTLHDLANSFALALGAHGEIGPLLRETFLRTIDLPPIPAGSRDGRDNPGVAASQGAA